MSEKIVVIGAGSVGTNVALFLSKLGFEVELIESNKDILQGAPQTTFVNHGDGFEYYKPNHQRTGKYCIDGSFVKGLIYPLNAFKTDICSEDNPIRFFVSNSSINNGYLSFDSFKKNAEQMQIYFSRQFKSICRARGFSIDTAKKLFLREPNSFFRLLDKHEFEDIANVVGGCSGSSFGINMPHYYAFLKAALAQYNVLFTPSSNIDLIEKIGGDYLIHTNKKTIKANYIILSAGHHIPEIIEKIKGVSVSPIFGTFYLNSITFVKLPATTDLGKIKECRHINFTLQGEGGGMFACVVAPTQNEDGFGALYYPSQEGSQKHYISSPSTEKKNIFNSWDYLISTGLSKDDFSVQNTFKQACYLYPFLENYAEVLKATCRPVFNVTAFGNKNGKDRRVREISTSALTSSDDGKISIWAAPKWTNAEIVALMAVDHLCKLLTKKGLPNQGKTRFGPTELDIAEISKTLHFKNIKMNIEDAYKYAREQGVPEKVVDSKYSEFWS